MSINMDTSGDNYSDFEVQHIRHSLERTVFGSVVPNGEFALERSFEPTTNGLDRNELAEIVGMRRQAAAFVYDEGSNAPGVGKFFGGLGINVSGQEWLWAGQEESSVPSGDLASGSAAEPQERYDTDGNGDLDFTERFKDTDERGLLDSFVTNGAEKSTGGIVSDYFVNFRELFGQGPFIDANDDIDTYMFIEADDLGDSFEAYQVYQLYYKIHEAEDSRPIFGPR